MGRIAINKVWASETTNKAQLSQDDIGRGIIYESNIESKYPNAILNQSTQAIKELQESGAFWIESKEYTQGSIVSLLVSNGHFISTRMYIKTSAIVNNSFPLQSKIINKTLGNTCVYEYVNIEINSNDWQIIGGYMSNNLIGDYNKESKAYEYGENCYIWYNIATQAISLSKPNPCEPYVWQRVLLQSCKDNNTTLPSVDSLRNDWIVQDGYDLGHILIDSVDRTQKLGYMLINNSNINSQYTFTDFPRLKAIFASLSLNTNKQWSVFKKTSETTFKIANDYRSYFMRAYGHDRGLTIAETNRSFYDLQAAGVPNIKGSLIHFRDRAVVTDGCFKRKNLNPLNQYTLYDNNTNNDLGIIEFDANLSNTIYKDSYDDVTPYNFNVNLFVKI